MTIAGIEAAFDGPIVVFRDHAHSWVEERFKAIAGTTGRRHVLIVFALRRRGDATFIRPIGARSMHAKEIASYEEEAARIAQR